MKLNALALSAVAMLTLAVGCGVADENATQDEQVTAQACLAGQRTCLKCDGTGTYCATRCGECAAPIAAPDVEAAGSTCKAGDMLCPKCDGSGTYCAARCFECAPSIVADPDPSVSAMGSTSCPPRQFLCQRCDGSTYCAPECAPCL